MSIYYFVKNGPDYKSIGYGRHTLPFRDMRSGVEVFTVSSRVNWDYDILVEIYI